MKKRFSRVILLFLFFRAILAGRAESFDMDIDTIGICCHNNFCFDSIYYGGENLEIKWTVRNKFSISDTIEDFSTVLSYSVDSCQTFNLIDTVFDHVPTIRDKLLRYDWTVPCNVHARNCFIKTMYLPDTTVIHYSELFSIHYRFQVFFPDSVFEAAIRSLVEKPSGAVYNLDLEYRRFFSASPFVSGAPAWERVERIDGIQHAIDLEYLLLYGNSVTDLTRLRSLKKLFFLSLDDNRIDDLAPLDSLKRLKYLYLYRNKIRNLSVLAGMEELKELDLFDNRVEDISPLSGLKELRYLDLSWNRLNDDDLDVLAGLPELGDLLESRPLDLRGNLGFSEERIRRLAEELPHYEYEDILWRTPAGTLEMVFPNGGEALSPGDEHGVVFVNKHVRDWVDLEISYDGGRSYTVLDSFRSFEGKKTGRFPGMGEGRRASLAVCLSGRRALKEDLKKPVFTDTVEQRVVLPEGKVSDSCVARVVSRLDDGVKDESDGLFSVTGGETVVNEKGGSHEGLKVSHYPNPFREEFVLRIRPHRSGNAEVWIYDLTGRRLHEGTYRCSRGGGNEIRIDGGSWPSGIYFYRVRLETGEEIRGEALLLK